MSIAAFRLRRPAPALLAALLLLAAAPPSLARDRAGAITGVQVAPDLEREWLLQLAPGSGVVPGYRRPELRRNAGYADPSTIRGTVGYSRLPEMQASMASPAKARDTAEPPVARPAATPVAMAAQAPVRAAKPAKDGAGRGLDPRFLPQDVDYTSPERPGTLIIDTNQRFLYLVQGDGKARRYGVGVGKPGFEWAGRHQVTRKSEWPVWTPPEQMRERERAKGRILPVRMEGGPENPLGARAMYLGSTLYRIHGTNQPWSIGKAVSSGCIRMRNEDVMDLYGRVPVGTTVIVL
ncbi:L,D-transpeptidase [Aureimonas endophytica]|uniref:L,D-transpeptidase n=1 Tax=Aureimonas endophytica TaxID=2027858 RepID=A0A917E2X1_9HYPH|nr:L,D-transpeptidase [Aureimonas endophytica]GGD97572.1 L,D-transpeptidase [Aureimonas endophytica]